MSGAIIITIMKKARAMAIAGFGCTAAIMWENT